MAAILKSVTAAGIQRIREDGRQCDAVEVAYLACLLEEQAAWPAATQEGGASAAAADGQQQRLTLCSGKLSEDVLAIMAERVRQELVHPVDPATAATAHLQVALERRYKEQQEFVEAEQAQHSGAAARLASAVAYKKVYMQVAGLPLYQTVFGQIVDYVCAAAGLEARAANDPDARAQVSAAVESVLPLSSLAYFLTLPAQERMQQMEAVAAISCGICLFNSHSGNAPSPVTLSADTQLLQAMRLLSDVQAAAAQAEAALDHYNMPGQQVLAAPTNPALAAAAAAYLGSSSSPGGSSSSAAAPQLGAVLFCCQAAVALRALAVDLSAGIRCCRQLHNELLSVLSQAAQVTTETPGAAVLKEQVFPMFESAGRMHVALKGELRLLLVRGRLWEGACGALAAAAERPGVPNVLGFKVRRHLLGGSSTAGSGSSRALTAAPSVAVDSSPGVSTAPPAAAAAALFDASSLPADMEFVPSAAAAASLAGEEAGGGYGLDIVGDTRRSAAGLQVQAEPQALSLSGMCPVSIAGSVAAGRAAAAAGDAEAVAAGEWVLLLGRLARPEFGMLRYAGKLYGFSSLAALAAFASSPETVLDAVRRAAHSNPLLLHTLGLSSASPAAAAAGARPDSCSALAASARGGSVSVSAGGGSSGGGASNPGSSSSSGSPVSSFSAAGGGSSAAGAGTGGYRGSSAGVCRSSAAGGGAGFRWHLPPLRGLLELLEAPLKVEAGSQTVTHAAERLVDVNYEWNEWALRRRVIAPANLRQKATHSAQTVLSGFRREGASQTWLSKEAAVQTKVNKGSSVPKTLRYVTGLRGGPDTKMAVVSLELDVHGKGAGVQQHPGRRQ